MITTHEHRGCRDEPLLDLETREDIFVRRFGTDRGLPEIEAGVTADAQCSFFDDAESLPDFVVRNNSFKIGDQTDQYL